MEKYKKWTDAATGINPFVPAKVIPRNSGPLGRLFHGIKKYLVAPIFAVVRMLVAIVVFPLLALSEVLSKILFVRFLQRLFLRLAFGLFGRFLLLLLGFRGIHFEETFLRRQSATQKRSLLTRLFDLDVRSGDLIVCNSLSYVEPLYLAIRYVPVFASVSLQDPSSPKVVPSSLTATLFRTARHSTVLQQNGKDLKDVLLDARKRGLGPVVVMPEAVTSNGQCVLDFQKVLRDLRSITDLRVHVIAFKYDYLDFSPSFPVGSFFGHLFRLCCQFKNVLQAHLISQNDIPLMSSAPTDDEWSEQIRTTMATALRVRKVASNAAEKAEFLDYWRKTYGKKYVKPTKKQE